ncbi:hypothetical protein DENSPDRAFT_514769 [Dentipellis sp. KUC8613]|nr:hypothetical protein DENSPDRAFT_514769 [Dentipellis sp. KUC8613]
MAYPSTPGGLPSALYRDMSSLRIASPRASHARASPYPYPSDNTRAVGSPRRSLPPDLYNGMSSMHVSSPYHWQSHSSLSSDAHTAHLHTLAERKFDRSHHTSKYPGLDNHSQAYAITSVPISQQDRDCKVAPEGLNAEHTRHLQYGQERPMMSPYQSSPQCSTEGNMRGHIKTENMESEDWDFLEQVYPQSSQISLQAVFDEDDARDEDCERGLAASEETLLRQLEEHPNNPSYLKQLKAVRTLKQVHQNQKQLLRRIAEYEWSRRESRRRNHQGV